MFTVEFLENGDKERQRLAAARLGGSEYVLAFQGEGDGAGLDVGQDFKMGGPQTGGSRGGEWEMGEVLDLSGFRVLDIW